MNDQKIEAVLAVLAGQSPRISAQCTEDMLRSVRMLNTLRSRGKSADPTENKHHAHEHQSSPPAPKKNANQAERAV